MKRFNLTASEFKLLLEAYRISKTQNISSVSTKELKVHMREKYDLDYSTTYSHIRRLDKKEFVNFDANGSIFLNIPYDDFCKNYIEDVFNELFFSDVPERTLNYLRDFCQKCE